MDELSRAVAELLHELAAVNEANIALARKLWHFAGVKASRSGVDLRVYEVTGWAVEWYTEADLTDDRVVCWWLDLSMKDNRWLVRSNVSIDNDQIRPRPDRSADTLLELKSELQSAMSELDRSMNRIPELDPRRELNQP